MMAVARGRTTRDGQDHPHLPASSAAATIEPATEATPRRTGSFPGDVSGSEERATWCRVE